MKPITVFHDGKVIAQSNEWINSRNLPAVAYIYDRRTGDGSWYRTVGTPGKPAMGPGAMPINACDIPKWVKAWMLILT